MGLHKSKSITTANCTLTKWFNTYIRLRDIDSEGVANCISCDKPITYSEAEAGHFIRSKVLATRWMEENVNVQCHSCNHSDNGMQYFHGKAIGLKYGEDVLNEIIETANGETPKLSKDDRMALARKYKQMAEELAKIKGIKIKS